MRKLLIADDEKIIREGIAKLIQASSLPVTIVGQAANGRQALEMMQSTRPDLVIIDITMPAITGLDVIEQSKDFLPSSKFIIVSGHDSFPFAQKAIELGAFHYLLKPIKRSQLLSVVEHALETLEKKEEVIVSTDTDITSVSDATNGTVCEKVSAYINDHHCDSNMSLNFVADKFHISQSYLTRIIKKSTNLSFTEYLNKLRIQQAIFLLSSRENLLIAQIAELVGYSSQHYFSRVFKNHTGVSPVEYRNMRG
ncbi:response regulator transcription factor [Lachnoclostridium phytofermentans]|uniref:Stage 0 sporulation protein A homolog n=1 Tax=Lachnoclostridium phytofermentans (strain ATCC 700394 / DSM 18823 / ISDg) TaxID=357809 RepID=A9KL85_LACP7|nr:response regulator [Lachnoclostridium phytofermentans]ABX44234.1 two component transcriptional regulator, AraC family [Lachnoclostridium phytofermentans ISDg]